MVYYSRMTLRDRIRAFLGLPAILDSIKRLNEDMIVITLDIPSLAMFKAMGLKQADRHREIMNALEALNYKRNIAAGKPQPILDWEAQQTAFLNNPENFKEEN